MRNPLIADGFLGNNCKKGNHGYDVDNEDVQGLFPRYSEWIVFVVTLVLRCNYVSQKDNWWVLHPDEIFQAMEVAYSELQGYGFRPYEFLPPASGPNVTSARMQERMLGMYAMRSFIYPRILTGVGYIALLLGYNSSLFVLWRIFHASITSCLPLSVYVFCKVVTGNHDLSMISCILVASSTHLWVFGTHTLLNSFFSPFVFLVIGYLIKFITAFSVENNINGNVQEMRNGIQHINNNNNDYNIHTMNNCNGIHRCNKQVDTSNYESVQIGRSESRVCHVQYQSVPNSTDNSVKDWTYEGKTDSHDVNVCLDFIGQQSDVTGVFMDRDIHMTGGYTVLRQNVPWFSLINTEFREFSKESRLAVWSFYGNREISITSQISNYVHIQNTPFLLKCLIRQKEYNYLVMKITRQFITRGYVEVFRYGTMHVLKRSFDSQEESYLEKVEKSITDNRNTTILKYEGQWLMSYGSYNLAENKFIKSAEINSDLQVYQFLVELYRRKGEPVKARDAFTACKQKFVEADCLKNARKITLFEHERISLK
uniref:Mannosyltransferase n=1 Tax=Magallana gigas TaxID=29159 RepID=K1PAF7_MAGGI